jgi:threonine dehydrogenase-like Zn-dependent dehydrogenase
VDYVAGHEVAGDVVALGPGVSRLKASDRVAVNNVRGCGRCPACLEGAFVRCAQGIRHMGHGFAELVAVPEANCLVLDGKIDHEAGSLIFDVWGTPFAAYERAGTAEPGDTVVFGCGPIGLAAVALGKARGARVIAVDPLAYRREAALRMGAAAAAAYRTAFEALAVGGTLVSIGEGAAFELLPSEALIPKQLNMLGTLYSTMEQGEKVHDMMIRGEIDPLAFVTHRFSLKDLPGVFGRVVDCEEGILKAIVRP